MQLPDIRQEMLNVIVAELIKVEHVVAIVLGGSHATGMATENSDTDIGIYYYEEKPFDIEAIRTIVMKYDKGKMPVVTDFYQWGPWVNGGAWLETEAGKVDFLYRNIDQVRATIEKSVKGEWEKHYEQQPPYGFSSVIYLAETRACIPLYDPRNIIGELKAAVEVYPPALGQTIIQQSLWSAEFTMIHAEKFAAQTDIYNVAGCLTRAVKNIVDAIFAINEIYPIGDKRAVEVLEKLKIHPPDLTSKIENILIIDRAAIEKNIACLKALFQEVVASTEGRYKSLYNFKK